MPCNHKFKQYLDLQLLDFQPETLIVGSFSPEWPESNTAQWFYGRIYDAEGTRINHFWEVLPRIYGEPGLSDATPAEWKQFCRRHKIALTDFISCVDDADPAIKDHNHKLSGTSDDAIVYNFDDFEFTNVVRLLQQHPTIGSIYLTRGVTDAFWRHLWNPVAQYCNKHHLRDRILLSPTGATLYQHQAHNTENPHDIVERVEDYILRRWKVEWEP